MVYGVSESFACVPVQTRGWPHAPRVTSALAFQGERTHLHPWGPAPLSPVKCPERQTL